MISREEIADAFRTIQDEICSGLESLDGKATFQQDQWSRAGGGGGRTRVLSGGNLIEKGGVNFSEVFGDLPEALKNEFKNGNTFFATGVSIVLHPGSPMVPIIHMNIRYFEVDSGEKWFGGGIDLTPHYVDEKMAKQFHAGLKKVCDTYNAGYYTEFSKWADDYFYIPHRNETRGIGGIFFDHLAPRDAQTWDDVFAFVKAVGRSFVSLYTEQVSETRSKPYTDAHKKWQLLRRGRYVEFNLVHDRGTRFGLLTGGRTESILMSLPVLASWEYDYQPAQDSAEARTLLLLKKGLHRA